MLWPDYGDEHLQAALAEFAAGSGAMAASWPMTSLPQAKRFDWSTSACASRRRVVLVPGGRWLAVWFGGLAFLVLIAVGVALLAIEWGGMSAPRAPTRVAAAVTAGGPGRRVFVGLSRSTVAWPGSLLVVGAVAAGLIARGRGRAAGRRGLRRALHRPAGRLPGLAARHRHATRATGGR